MTKVTITVTLVKEDLKGELKVDNPQRLYISLVNLEDLKGELKESKYSRLPHTLPAVAEDLKGELKVVNISSSSTLVVNNTRGSQRRIEGTMKPLRVSLGLLLRGSQRRIEGILCT
jgi:hypothetical protein